MDRFLIAPINEGQQSDVKPFMIPDQAFASLNNAYPYRGRIRKRFGAFPMNTSVAEGVQQLHTRLRTAITPIAPIALGNTDAAGNAAGVVVYPYFFIGQTFTVGVETYTIVSLLPGVQPMLATMGAGTFNVTTGAFTIAGGPINTAITFNPFNSTTNAFGNAVGVAPGAAFVLGQMFSVGNEKYTVIDETPGVHPMISTAGVASFDTTTGVFVINGATPLTPVYFYPAQPVMGFVTYETGVANDNEVLAFDTQFSYRFTGGAWSRAGAATWTGSDSQFFWGTTWQSDQSYENLLFVTNYNRPDQIKYWNSAAWTDFTPATLTAANNNLQTARILITFKDRLVALNTIEEEGVAGVYRTHNNRARWSQNGSPVQANAWQEDIPGKGGWIDAATRQSIITAQILRDRLIVYFESSTWELVYTGNESLPFRWQQLNTELGAESTFSQIPFDKVVLGIGNVGIHACNGAQVERIDEKIPQDIFEIHGTTDGIRRVAGIRDFYTELVYWTIPVAAKLRLTTYKFPNRVLVYNYKTASWAYNDDSITAFGYYEQQDSVTWQQLDVPWEDMDSTWSSGQLQAHPKRIIAGNQEGFTFLVDTETSRNSIALSITNITPAINTITAINHNLTEDDFILIENCQGMTDLNENIYQIVVIDKDTFTLLTDPIGAGYTGGGTITRVSQISILTKQYNFYLKQSRNAYISKVDFLVNNEGGLLVPQGGRKQMYVECYPSYSSLPGVAEGVAYGVNPGNGVLDISPYQKADGTDFNPFENWQTQFWHPVYFQVEGESVQLEITLTEEQMLNPVHALSNFTLNAIAIYAMPTTSRLQ